jgi:NADH-quinone oxidoreductase subunit C
VSALAAAVVAAVTAPDVTAPDVTATDGFGPATVDVPRERWVEALEAAYAAGAAFFDLLTAYDLGADGFAVVAHVATPDAHDHLLLRTRVPRDAAALATATAVYRGAAWHERETHEMFGIGFVGNERLDPLLLPAGFGAAPLRKDFVLAARAARPWPGEKDPADSGGRTRRRVLPPGVPADWPAAGPEPAR